MKIISDGKGNIIIDKSEPEKLEIHAFAEVWSKDGVLESTILKENGGLFDNIVAFSAEEE